MVLARTICLILLCLSATAEGATYYVAKGGSDSNPGTIGSPWLTITKAAATALAAGDTVMIGDGDYDEHVAETSSGSAGNFITYQAINRHQVSMRAFRLSGGYIKLNGIKFSGYQNMSNSWNSAVRVENSASGSMIDDCLFTGYPHLLGHDFQFDAATNRVISPSGNFISAGFRVGGKVYLGASGATYNGVPLYYVNHDTTWTISAVEETSLTLSGASMSPDTGTNYWAFVRAGTGSEGNIAISFILAGGTAANNVTIQNCRFDQWAAGAMELVGNNHIIQDNICERSLSFRFCQFRGGGHIIRRNVVRNCPNVLHYSDADMATITHPAGTGWYDYQVGMLSGWPTTGVANDNVTVESNWFEDIDNQLGRLDSILLSATSGSANNVTYSGNVFIGISQQFSGGRPGMKWLNNTFYKCTGYHNNQAPAHPLQIGGRDTWVSQTGYELKNNLFVACGPAGALTTLTRGYYALTSTVSPITDYNFVTSEEVTGYAPKSTFVETNGITGGDPVFANELDFDGPDDTPFTEDDGLKVLATSPAAALGGGACGVKAVVTGQPIAHFRLTSPQGWFEGEKEDYDPTWITKLPTQRGTTARPWDAVVSIGTAPVSAAFNAEKSISGVGGSTTNAAITTYAWSFGDGSSTSSGITTTSHTYTSGGEFTVTLTVTNSDGNTHSYSRKYKVGGTVVGQVLPSVPTGLRVRTP